MGWVGNYKLVNFKISRLWAACWGKEFKLDHIATYPAILLKEEVPTATNIREMLATWADKSDRFQMPTYHLILMAPIPLIGQFLDKGILNEELFAIMAYQVGVCNPTKKFRYTPVVSRLVSARLLEVFPRIVEMMDNAARVRLGLEDMTDFARDNRWGIQQTLDTAIVEGNMDVVFEMVTNGGSILPALGAIANGTLRGRMGTFSSIDCEMLVDWPILTTFQLTNLNTYGIKPTDKEKTDAIETLVRQIVVDPSRFGSLVESLVFFGPSKFQLRAMDPKQKAMTIQRMR